jgi:hypothetical protein
MAEWRARLWQDGMVVAAVSGPDGQRVEREILHYAVQYEKDGPVRVKIIPPKGTSFKTHSDC